MSRGETYCFDTNENFCERYTLCVTIIKIVRMYGVHKITGMKAFSWKYGYVLVRVYIQRGNEGYRKEKNET